MSTDHAQSLRLGQRGVAPTPGVQLVTLATLPSVAYPGQIVYALDLDEFRVYDGDAWQIPTAAATGGLQTFVQATEPTADNVGDLWMKTTNYTLYVWDGVKWQVTQDADAPTRDLWTWNLAQWLLSHSITATTRIYYIAADPTTDPDWTVVNGHFWFKSDTNQLYKRTSGSWVENTDAPSVKVFNQAGYPQAIGFDQTIDAYFQTTIPWANGTPDHGEDIGDIWIDTDAGNAVYGFNGLWVLLSDRPIVQNAIAAAAAQTTADDALTEASTDGSPPASSPTPETLSGVGLFIVKWTPITNADPVIYEIHVSSVSGFTADSSTLIGQTSSSQFVIKSLPGSPPAPGDPDPRELDYDTTYYVRVIAKDADGAAAQSAQASANAFRVTGVDIEADTITGANIVAGTLTGDLLSATVLLAGTIKTAESGQRVEVGIAGVQGYKSDNSLMINLPTDPTQTALVDAEVVARSLVATNGGTLRGTTTVDTAGTVNLKRITTAPVTAPQMTQSYVTLQPVTTSLANADKTGSLGTFDLVPAEVTCMEWKDATTDYFVLHQIRSTGTRAWFFKVSDGTPIQVGGVYFNDYINWELHSVWQIPSGGTHPGVYRMGRWIPDGSLNTYYMWSPAGLNRYSRQNGLAAPAIGSDGNDIFVAEVVQGTTNLRVRYFVPDGSGANLASPFSTVDSSLGYVDSHGLCTILYGNFDYGAARYAVAERGWNTNQRSLVVSGGAFYPAGTSNNWASADKEAESFESPTSNRRAMAWDGANSCFWTYGGDGLLYRHTSTFWNPNSTSSKVWAQHTFYDSNATGGTHESTPGPAANFTWKRRSSIMLSHPALPPGGGSDDPNQIRTYMGRGSSQPANAAMWLQYSSSGTTATVSTITLSGTNPPTVNNFPNATPGKITNDAATLAISGDGSIAATTGTFSGAVSSVGYSGTTGTFSGAITTAGDPVAINGPYYYAWINSAPAVASGTISTVSGYTGITSSGITRSGDTFTLPDAGRYRFYGQLYWGTQPTPVGDRLCQWVLNGTITFVSHTAQPGSTSNVVTCAHKTLFVNAGDTAVFRWRQQAGGSAGPVVTSQDLSYIMIEWVGP